MGLFLCLTFICFRFWLSSTSWFRLFLWCNFCNWCFNWKLRFFLSFTFDVFSSYFFLSSYFCKFFTNNFNFFFLSFSFRSSSNLFFILLQPLRSLEFLSLGVGKKNNQFYSKQIHLLTQHP